MRCTYEQKELGFKLYTIIITEGFVFNKSEVEIFKNRNVAERFVALLFQVQRASHNYKYA